MSKFTLFTEVLNGEPLLPYWLEHHRRIFEHGVIIYYPSEDNSLDIIRTICPDWEVVAPIKHLKYDCAGVDEEVMMQEAKHSGWKMALNITEFAVTQNLNAVVRKVPPKTRCILPVDVAVMVDTPGTANDKLDPAVPILQQKHHGLFAKDYPLWRCRHSRQLHRGTHGQYDVGRHNSGVTPRATSPLLYVAWFAWSPYNAIRDRKQAVKAQLSAIDLQVKRGWQHLVSVKEQDARFAKVSAVAYDLNKNPGYRAAARRSR